VSLLYDNKNVSSLSILSNRLSWADTAASIFGRLYGSRTPALPSPPFAARKSSAGFFAAFIVASLTAAFFWATPIAQSHMRPEGLSIYNEHGRAAFGTSSMHGAFGSGWTGSKWGFRPRHPDIWDTSSTSSGVLHRVTETIRQAASSGTQGSNQKATPLPVLCLGSGLVAAVAEALELGGVDDNLSLPILSSVGIHLLLVTWGWVASLIG
jgi:diacylglycerol kinase (CTP)